MHITVITNRLKDRRGSLNPGPRKVKERVKFDLWKAEDGHILLWIADERGLYTPRLYEFDPETWAKLTGE